MPFLNQTRRDSVGSQTIAKYGLGGGAGGTQATTYVENPSSADRPPSYDDIQDWPGAGGEVVLDDGSTGLVTAALLSDSSVLATTIAPGAVLATSTGFRGLPWQVHTAEFELVQSPLSPFFEHSTSEWEIFRLDYTTFSEGAFSPSNASPSTQAYGVAIGTTAQTGRWWSHRLAVESSRLPSPSPDIHIFPQDINFSASDSGSLFVAVRVGSSVSLGSLGLYSWGYNGTAWRSRNHLFTSTSLGTCSTLALAPNIIAASNIINGAVTSPKLAAGAILSTSIAAGAVLSTSIGNFAVAAINLGTNAVTTPKLQDASVTPAKLSFDWQELKSVTEVNTTLDAGFTAKASSNPAITYRNLVLQPRGVGAIQAAPGDASDANGNLRGTHALDLQMARSLAREVAEGNYSALLGGRENSIFSTAPYSAYVGGAKGQIRSIYGHAHGPFAYVFNRHTDVHGHGRYYQTNRMPLARGWESTPDTDGWYTIRPWNAASGVNGFRLNLSGNYDGAPGTSVITWRVRWMNRTLDTDYYVLSEGFGVTSDLSRLYYGQASLSRTGGGAPILRLDCRVVPNGSEEFLIQVRHPDYPTPDVLPEPGTLGGGIFEWTHDNGSTTTLPS